MSVTSLTSAFVSVSRLVLRSAMGAMSSDVSSVNVVTVSEVVVIMLKPLISLRPSTCFPFCLSGQPPSEPSGVGKWLL